MHQRDYLVRRSPVLSSTLLLFAFALTANMAHAGGEVCSMDRVSTRPDGSSSTGSSSRGTLSADGRFVAFESTAADLVEGDTNGVTDIFVHDRWTGTTDRVSVGFAGAQANQSSYRAMICGNGRFVAFESDATNLVAGDTNASTDVFVYDRQTKQMTRVSVGASAVQANLWSLRPSISFDGRYVAFHSAATNLVANDVNGVADVFVRDRVGGVTERVSVTSSELPANYSSQGAAISSDGRYVAFESFATNLVPGLPIHQSIKYIFLRDRTLGTTEIVSLAEDGALPNGTSQSASISADGSTVAFETRATNLSPVTPGFWNVYIRDTVEDLTTLISGWPYASDNGGGDSEFPTVSADGRFIVFTSFSAQIVEDETDDFGDVYVYDRQIDQATRVSLASDDSAADGSSSIAHTASITPSGREIVFHGLATNLVAGDNNGQSDVFVKQCVETPFTAFCPGTQSACPCANATAAYGGCQNSFSTGGAVLSASGDPSVGADKVTLTVTGLPPLSQALFFQSDAVSTEPLGEVLGDGLRCTAGQLIRLGLRTGASGSVSFGHLVSGDPSVAARGGVPAEGATRHYQALYRDNGNFCTPSNVNLSNAITIGWQP